MAPKFALIFLDFSYYKIFKFKGNPNILHAFRKKYPRLERVKSGSSYTNTSFTFKCWYKLLQEEDDGPVMSLKELEEEKRKLKENQQRNVSLFLILGQIMLTKSGLISLLMIN